MDAPTIDYSSSLLALGADQKPNTSKEACMHYLHIHPSNILVVDGVRVNETGGTGPV